MALTAAQVHGLSESLLKRNYDDATESPPFHQELWQMCCSDAKQVAIAAPRSHAKSTAVTHAYTLANILFREKQHILIVSATEDISKNFLGDIKKELIENEDLKELFQVKRFLKEAETEVVVEFSDGWTCRIIAKGSEQKLRGIKWRGKRPDLIVCDDLEEDEQVLNKDRREKFKKWFLGALVPTLSRTGVIRVVGTILHLDSLLERLLNNSQWTSKRYKAHNEDFSYILWPEQWPEERLKAKRQEYIDEGFPEGYAQEYLNYPIDEASAYFQRPDFKEIKDFEECLVYYAAADFAVSTNERADFTVIAVCGVNSKGKVKVVDIRRGRWDTLDIIEEMFSVQKRYSPDLFTVERGAIERAIGPVLYAEMYKSDRQIINLNPMVPTKDKTSRARSLQGRMRSGGVEFDVEAPWFPALQDEMLRFPKDKHDDQVDALAWIGLTLDKVVNAPSREEIEEEEWQEEYGDSFFETGMNSCTGY